MLVWSLGELAGAVASRRFMISCACGGLVAACLALTVRQVGFWKDSESLFRHTIQATRDNYLAEHNLGAALIEKNQLAEATEHFAESVRLKPGYAQAQSDLGLALAFQGKITQAIDHYRLAIEARPGLDKPHYNLGSALRALGKKQEAAAEFEAALRLNPGYTEARSALATVLAEEGNFEEACRQFTALVGQRPNDPDLHREFGRLLQSHGKSNEASQQFAEVLRLRPNDPAAHQELALVLADGGQLTESVHHLKEALRLQPSAGGYYQLALVFDMQGNRPEAAQNYKHALELHSDWPPAMNDLAWLLATAPEAQLRNGQEAVRLASKACELSKNREARFLGTLDAAYAEAGDFKRAIETAERVDSLARESGQTEVSTAALKRLESYRRSEPYHQK
jgi:tetratricopeptide (TPR) repeat protein